MSNECRNVKTGVYLLRRPVQATFRSQTEYSLASDLLFLFQPPHTVCNMSFAHKATVWFPVALSQVTCVAVKDYSFYMYRGKVKVGNETIVMK